MSKPLTDLDYVKLYAAKLKGDSSLFAQQKRLIESQLEGSASLFKSFLGESHDFKLRARAYLRATGLMQQKHTKA